MNQAERPRCAAANILGRIGRSPVSCVQPQHWDTDIQNTPELRAIGLRWYRAPIPLAVWALN
jgi:hypothetical protein